MFDSFLPVIIILMFGVPHGAADTYLAKKIDIPPRSAQVISTKKTYFYLEENF